MIRFLFLLAASGFSYCYSQTENSDSIENTLFGKFFVTHKVQQEIERIHEIASATDTKDIEDTTISIFSVGEGWMNKDSLPIGKWKFYSIDINGNEYLLKEGDFKVTEPDMFEIIQTDLSQFKQLFDYSEYKLKFLRSQLVKYIKCGEWNYFHPNGRIWKRVKYKCDSIPVNYVISQKNLGENENIFSYSSSANQNFGEDEYFESSSPILEFGTDGKLYKKIYVGSFNTILYKAYYDKEGKIIREFPYRGKKNYISLDNVDIYH